ncbi:MAG: hypothetical protein IIY78_02170 [Clostridia bacterium]|nr:hypothetical protein [Clostridia bacterium]
MTYESIKNHIAESRGELPLSAKNENGELVIIKKRNSDGIPFYRLTTVQDNNWCRINCYYADGTIDETYER